MGGAALAAPTLPPQLQGSSLTWRPQPLLALVHSVAVTSGHPSTRDAPRVLTAGFSSGKHTDSSSQGLTDHQWAMIIQM